VCIRWKALVKFDTNYPYYNPLPPSIVRRENPALRSDLHVQLDDFRPTVSIVTPSFNQGRYIARTIDSVLSQDYPLLEYLVMDGGSNDETPRLLERSAAQSPKRMRFVSEKDRGQTHALNKAVAQTTGKIIGWLNSDDTFHPRAVSNAVRFFEQNPDVDLVYGNADFTDPYDRFIARCAHVEPFDWQRLVHYTDFIVQPAAFFTRRAFEAVGGADESLCYAMDYDLFLKIAARFKVAHLPDVLASYRWSGENKTAVGEWARLEEIERVTAAFGACGLPAYTRIEAAFLGLRLALREARRGRINKSAHHLAAGAQAVFSSPRTWRSLASPACWKVMWTGQILRRRERELRKARHNFVPPQVHHHAEI
jgi:glycosyltransferase involved in cell wall biosynthesis